MTKSPTPWQRVLRVRRIEARIAAANAANAEGARNKLAAMAERVGDLRRLQYPGTGIMGAARLHGYAEIGDRLSGLGASLAPPLAAAEQVLADHRRDHLQARLREHGADRLCANSAAAAAVAQDLRAAAYAPPRRPILFRRLP